LTGSSMFALDFTCRPQYAHQVTELTPVNHMLHSTMHVRIDAMFTQSARNRQ